nr:hypothetical protein [Clostridium sp.]
MNGFNPMGMMYGDTSMNEYEDEENEESSQVDNYEDREAYNRPIRPNPQYNDADSIVRRIEKYNPAIFRHLTRCGIPYVEVREMVRRIVRLTLMYREE